MSNEPNIYMQSLMAFLFFAVSFFTGYILRWFFAGKKLRETEHKAKLLMDSAKHEAEHRKKEVELQGKDLLIKLRQDFEKETEDRRKDVLVNEKRLQQKEENLEKRVDLLELKEKDITRNVRNLCSRIFIV